MKKIILFSILCSLSIPNWGYACVINSFSKIIKLNKVLDDTIIESSSCDEKTQRVFVDLISGASGELKARHLKQILKSEFKIKVDISPENIQVEGVKETLTKLIQLPKDLVLKKTASLFGSASLNLRDESNLKVICNTCETAGNKNIKLLVNNKPIWFSAEILQRRVGFISVQSVSPYTKKLSRNTFRKTYIFDNGRDLLFQDIENIRFYKPTRQLKKGHIVKASDLVPLTIVKPGQKIKVILKGNNISLNSSALSRGAGKIGDFINVYNQKSNKRISAQVIDFNTVMVEI